MLRPALLVSTCILALSACDFVREKTTGVRYGDPVVGARRSPILNPKAGPGVATPAQKIVPSAPSSSPANPYDQYDAKGNEVGGQKNYVKEWLGDKPSEPAAAESSLPSGRKPFKGLMAASEPMPQPTAPVVESKPVMKNKPAQKIIPSTVPADENGVVVPLTEQRELIPQAALLSNLQPAAGGDQVPKEYPHLADVPKAPQELKDFKQGKDAVQKEMEGEFNHSMEEKKKLDEEPTDLHESSLPEVEGMIQDIDGAIHGDTPIVQAQAHGNVEEASPSAGK